MFVSILFSSPAYFVEQEVVRSYPVKGYKKAKFSSRTASGGSHSEKKKTRNNDRFQRQLAKCCFTKHV
jgi:hypothetical protein